jgi:Alginate export
MFLLGASVQFLSGRGYAQGIQSTPAVADPEENQTTPGVKGFFSRTVKVTGAVRVRVEAPHGSDFTVTPADAYSLTRIRFGVAFQPVDWLRCFGEAEDSRVEFYRVTPASTLSDPFEFRQGYVELGAIEGKGAKVRVGRQDLFLGSMRLISTGDWSNITKNFNVARGTLTASMVNLDLIAGSVILDDPGRADRTKPGEHFYVAYSKWTKLVPGASIEPYVMAKTQAGTDEVKGKDNRLGHADILYGGLRIVGTVPGGFDYNAEAIREGGEYADDTVQSFAYILGGGWKWRGQRWLPHFSSALSRASGDSGRKDGHHESFDYLYGAQQPLTSLTGQMAFRNIVNFRAGADFTPFKKLKVQADFRDYWLATVQDGLYNTFGTRTVLNAKATSAHVGAGMDVQTILTITPKTFLGVGVGTLSPGAYLKQSNKNTGYVYPYLTFTRTL